MLHIVILPLLGMEDMHEDIAVIQHNPASRGVALLAAQAQAEARRLLLHLVAQRLDLRHGAAAAHDEPVRNHGLVPNRNGNNVARLLVVEYGKKLIYLTPDFFAQIHSSCKFAK